MPLSAGYQANNIPCFFRSNCPEANPVKRLDEKKDFLEGSSFGGFRGADEEKKDGFNPLSRHTRSVGNRPPMV